MRFCPAEIEGAPKGSRRNPNGRPKGDVIRLTKAARERFDRQLAENLDDVFKAILEVGTKDKDTAALSLLVTRAIPIRRSDGYLHRPHAHDATALQRSATSSRQSGRAS